MKTILLAASIALIAATSSVSANPFMPIENDPNVFVNNPVIEHLDEVACYGCISPDTGRIRNNYVSPHFRSNGTYVAPYWRS